MSTTDSLTQRVCAPGNEHLRRLWMPVTVRVAWELVVLRINVRPAVLTDAREHALRCVPDGAGASEAEVVAAAATRDYLRRVREGRYEPDLELTDEAGQVVPRQWRDALVASLDPVAEAVLRLHYGDGTSLQGVEQATRLDRAVLAGARDGLRHALRALSEQADVPDERVDGQLRRLAALPEPGCPGPMGLLSPAGLEHADRCPRCSRAARLLRGRVLAPADLFVPEGSPIPHGDAGVLALLLHPDGRRHGKRLIKAMGRVAVPAGPDTWLIPADQVGDVLPRLRTLCEERSPARHHLRGALLRGSGRWSRGVLLGPLPTAAIAAARARPWAELHGVCELPAPLPAPPSSARWWTITGGVGIAAVAAAALALAPAPVHPLTPVDASYQAQGGGWAVSFDADDRAVIDVVVLRGGQLEVLHRDLGAAKGSLSDGHGRYRIHSPGAGLAVIASPEGVPELEQLLSQVAGSDTPLDDLVRAVRQAQPRAGVSTSPRFASAS